MRRLYEFHKPDRIFHISAIFKDILLCEE